MHKEIIFKTAQRHTPINLIELNNIFLESVLKTAKIRWYGLILGKNHRRYKKEYLIESKMN